MLGYTVYIYISENGTRSLATVRTGKTIGLGKNCIVLVMKQII
jgi:hypothetical protein